MDAYAFGSVWRRVSIVLGMLWLMGSVEMVHAQIDTGSIVGTVRDQVGAVLPGVTVTATQQETGATLRAVTSDRGEYVLPSLKVGTYTIVAELSGLKRAARRDVIVHLQERLTIDLDMEVGDIREVVDIVVQPPSLLHTQQADVGLQVTERTVTDLPLLGRRYAELAFLAPGVQPAPGGITGRGEDTFFNANGNFATWNNFTLDGGDNNSFSTNLQERSVQVIQPPVDALAEFRVQTRTYSAEFGKAAGAVINASIKSGNNEFSGNAFEFFRDEALNANRWENNRSGLAKNKFGQNIFGGTLGGPIVREHTFFFVSYQATRTQRELTGQATVPTPLMRDGNLSELPRTLTNSSFIPAGCLDAASKVIASSCIDPVARNMIAFYPQPNIPAALAALGRPGGFVTPNYITNQLIDSDIDQIDLRGDQMLGSQNHVFGRYSLQDTDRREAPLFGDPVASGDFNSNNFIRGQSATGRWTSVWRGGQVFNQLAVAWNRIRSDSLHPAFGIDANAQIGLTGIPVDPRYSGGIPHTNIAGLTRIGGPFFRPQFQTSQVWQFSDSLTWIRGAHEIKTGIERRRDAVDYIDLRALNGFLSFNDGRYTNSGIGDFLLGLATQQGLTLFHQARLYTDGWQFYGQDAWRIAPTLTLTYGLRYEYFTPMQDRSHQLTNIDPATGQIVTSTDSGSIYDRTLIHPDRNNFAPRVGVAWTITPRVVMRGGYGIFYQHTDRYGSESQLALNPPQLVDVFTSASSANDPPIMRLRNGFTPVSAANVNPTLVQWRIQDPDQQTPTIQQFSVGPEYEIMHDTVVAIEYVGNLLRHGRKLRNLNQGIITTPGVGPVVFPYAQYGFGNAYLEQIKTDGKTNYHALQVRVQRRFAKGLAYTGQFTWGRALGNFLDHLSADGGGATGNFPLNAYDLDRDYGPLSFDIPKRFVSSVIYELPAGRGRKLQPHGVLGALVSDWNVNGILTLSDGRPFSIASADRANTGSGRTSRANCIGNPLPAGFDQTIDRWFDTTAFAEPTAFTYGDCGVNSLRGPGFAALNASAFRSFPIGDRRVELRYEVFNVLNRVNYANPGASVSTPGSFGRISSTYGDPREMQLAIKFYF
jgi:Carboxypeptidase regulatory-like domain